MTKARQIKIINQKQPIIQKKNATGKKGKKDKKKKKERR